MRKGKEGEPLCPTVLERFTGCLLGGAVGDASGAPVEFWSDQQILRRFCDAGVNEYLAAYARCGAITDDTQLTLFTAEGLIREFARARQAGESPDFRAPVGRAYLRWLSTQGEAPLPNSSSDSGWLIRQVELHERRAPGNTCLAALVDMTDPAAKVRNASKGCGGVMRTAPAGLVHWHFREGGEAPRNAFTLGCRLAAITHGHPSGFLPAGVLAAMVLFLLHGMCVGQALSSTMPMLRGERGHGETCQALEQARDLACQRSADWRSDIRQLGEGWVGEEALAIGVYCALRARTLEEALIMAVSHGGDSDSTGSIAGNLMGAHFGESEIPRRFLDELELSSVIEEVATDMATMSHWDFGDASGASAVRWDPLKYPPH